LLTVSYKKTIRKTFLRWVLLTIIYKKPIEKVNAQKKSNISYLTNKICSHGLPISSFVHPNPTIKKSKFKTETPRITNPFSFVFIYKKRDERETKKRKKERNKKQRREKKEIRNKEERQKK
jgi:hypothetical protein